MNLKAGVWIRRITPDTLNLGVIPGKLYRVEHCEEGSDLFYVTDRGERHVIKDRDLEYWEVINDETTKDD